MPKGFREATARGEMDLLHEDPEGKPLLSTGNEPGTTGVWEPARSIFYPTRLHRLESPLQYCESNWPEAGLGSVGVSMIPCYVSGKGMHATETTRSFKVAAILALEKSGLGYDTRHRYYRDQFPDLDAEALAIKVCDPVEYYDKDWRLYLEQHRDGWDEQEALAEFVLDRDARFRNEARAAIYCYDEAGLGSGVNTMRFIRDKKPILGFYHSDSAQAGTNLTNIVQLQYEAPDLVTLVTYDSLEAIPERITAWLQSR